ncbi:MAG TPA: hypothetical protein VFU23_10200, partial [Gemmatimonadales bacterium]|nr:hypothetical protein [Gemmatimonadales bacterium]
YSSAQLVKLVKTMQAELLAYYPRNAAENGTVNWGQVVTYASGGLSSGTPQDFTFYQDGINMIDGVKTWGNAIPLMRVDTRLAHNITDGPNPALIHKDPWPDPAGNPQPNAFDKRVGDGSWGPSEDFIGNGTVAETPNAGSDFAYAGVAIFRAARGQYHQSNLGQIRYSYLTYPGYGLPTEDGTGQAPVYTATMNDLLWAEGLIRSGGNAAQAAALINKTRVTRGGLSTLTGGEGTAALLAALQYEQDIELLGIGASPFYNRRRIDGLLAMTPRQMPIPAKELAILKKEFYSFGGPGNPAGLAPPVDNNGMPIISARERGERIIKDQLTQYRTRHRQ